MSLNTLELIVSPVQLVPVQSLFLTSTCSTVIFFSSLFPRFGSVHSTYDVPRFCSQWLHRIPAVPPFPVLIALVGSELREGIIEGFEPSSLCSYYPLSSAIAAPAHPMCLLPSSSQCPCYHFSSPHCYTTHVSIHSRKRFPSFFPSFPTSSLI